MAIKVPKALHTLQWQPDADPVWPGPPKPPEPVPYLPPTVHLGAQADPKVPLKLYESKDYAKVQVSIEQNPFKMAYTVQVYVPPMTLSHDIPAHAFENLGPAAPGLFKDKVSDIIVLDVSNALQAAFSEVQWPSH